MHCVTVLVFLNLLPLSKHFHIITAIPNVFFAKLPPRSADAAAGDHPRAGGSGGRARRARRRAWSASPRWPT